MEKRISFKTKFGWISAIEKDNNIIKIFFGKINNFGQSKNLLNLKSNINSYFLKKIARIPVKIKITGSALETKIWRELQKIPYGKTKSYGEIASIVKTSPRYVGNVCGKNRHLLVIPCHRVIRSDGKLGGFSGVGNNLTFP